MNLKKMWPLIAAGCAGLAVILALALPALKFDGEKASGWETVFPAKIMAMVATMPFLTVLLAVAGCALSVVAYLKPEKKVLSIAGAGCLAVAALFFFCWKPFYLNMLVEGDKQEYNWMKDYVDLGIGAILGGVLSLFGAGAAAANFLFNKD